MKFLSRLYCVVNYLSIDVAFGTIVCATFFSRILLVQPDPIELALLGITVWIIYTVDHLLDVRKLMREASSLRHRFHQKNFKQLFLAIIIAVAVNLLLILLVRKPVLYWGIGLTPPVVLYLAFQQRLVESKELVITILYTAGVLLPSISITEKLLTLDEIVLISFFSLTAFCNLIIFSWYDWKQDITDNHSSFVTIFGGNNTKIILAAIFVMQAALFVTLMLITAYQWEAFVLLLMNIVLLVLFLFPRKLSNRELYRLLGDGIFLFPLPYLILS